MSFEVALMNKNITEYFPDSVFVNGYKFEKAKKAKTHTLVDPTTSDFAEKTVMVEYYDVFSTDIGGNVRWVNHYVTPVDVNCESWNWDRANKTFINELESFAESDGQYMLVGMDGVFFEKSPIKFLECLNEQMELVGDSLKLFSSIDNVEDSPMVFKGRPPLVEGYFKPRMAFIYYIYGEQMKSDVRSLMDENAQIAIDWLNC